ncbi:sigma-70 family RNA polymerase sigma factor [Frankia sp. AiPa1]|uniref:sigma-70 family RNA polymerase sigma factor n=1 Tax=Frankia sp. AiPa1 TaxID=573492 RepID=UPI00202AF9EF|nr:sigma-70 family RNA polymerase sigma factor [Frankia sp. AiPa1]MCL9762493.1 sigma-70 family RNA polymerase sigma factor [Frankia sp. AiPa1]
MDGERFYELALAHRAALLAYCTHLTGGDRARAEDVVQETLLRAWHHLDRLTPERGSVHGWLRRVAHNLVVDGHRSRQTRPAEQELAPEHSEVAAAPDHAEGVVAAAVVSAVLDRIWPEHRAAIVEVYLHDRTCAQAASVLGLPEGTVKSRLHYALRSLRREAERMGLRAA